MSGLRRPGFDLYDEDESCDDRHDDAEDLADTSGAANQSQGSSKSGSQRISQRAYHAATREVKSRPQADARRGHQRQHFHQRAPSIATVESLSTIPTGEMEVPDEVKQIYQELQEINDKMKREFKNLHQRDTALKQKENALTELQLSLDVAIENEVKRRLHLKEQEHSMMLNRTEEALKEKTRESRRLKDNFEALKTANDILRRELETLSHSQDKLEKQYTSVQSRLVNLQRTKDHDDKKENLSDLLPADLATKLRRGIVTARESKPPPTRKSRSSYNTGEVLAALLDWLSESQLRRTAVDQTGRPVDGTTFKETIEDRCFKMLPSMVELLREQTSPNSATALPGLQFIYWALVHLEHSQSQHQKSSLSSTLRRLGEDLYRGKAATSSREIMDTVGETKDKQVAGLFFRSGHLHTRFLSSLVILKSISQVDTLALVYETLRKDLKSETGREYFLYYHATPIMLTHIKPSNKALTTSALDVYLQMSMDTPHLRIFLDSCSRENWFQGLSLLWKMPGIDPKQLEKMSILLQKLSQIKSNKKYFEVFGLTTSCQEIQRTVSSTNHFLSLNIRSILSNLSADRTLLKSSA